MVSFDFDKRSCSSVSAVFIRLKKPLWQGIYHSNSYTISPNHFIIYQNEIRLQFWRYLACFSFIWLWNGQQIYLQRDPSSLTVCVNWEKICCLPEMLCEPRSTSSGNNPHFTHDFVVFAHAQSRRDFVNTEKNAPKAVTIYTK